MLSAGCGPQCVLQRQHAYGKVTAARARLSCTGMSGLKTTLRQRLPLHNGYSY
jgi:hypothetical protein